MSEHREATHHEHTRPDSGTWPSAAFVDFEAEHVTDFLQGYLTCDVPALVVGRPQPCAICNVKGRVVASGWITLLDESRARLLVHESVADAVVRFMTPYARFARCTVARAPEPPALVRDTDSSEPLIGEWRLSDTVDSIHDLDLEMADALIDASFALVSAPVSERFLPQMLGLDAHHAVSFDKGCYLGQEIVARANFRGKVKRTLHTLELESGTNPIVGEEFEDRGTVIAVASAIDGKISRKRALAVS